MQVAITRYIEGSGAAMTEKGSSISLVEIAYYSLDRKQGFWLKHRKEAVRAEAALAVEIAGTLL